MATSEAGSDGIVMFADIDDSFLQSKRKSGTGLLHEVAFDSKGVACGFMTQGQRQFFDKVNATMTVIPNTARDSESLSRVRLPWRSFKICSYGGLILRPDGSIDQTWHARITEGAERNRRLLQDQFGLLQQHSDRLGIPTRRWCVVDGGNTLYAVAKHQGRDADELKTLGEEMRPTLPDGWYLHMNDNNLALIPDFLGKGKAATYLATEVLKPVFTIGLGDSNIDLSFMAGCDLAIIPTHSQIFTTKIGVSHGS